MNKWILTAEELPTEPIGINNDMDYEMREYIVTVSGATESTVLKYAGDGEWWDPVWNNFYNVTAWMELPPAYEG